MTNKPLPDWLRARIANRPASFRDDKASTVRSSPACAFCAALDAAHDAPAPSRIGVDLDAIEREHGACTCGLA